MVDYLIKRRRIENGVVHFTVGSYDDLHSATRAIRGSLSTAAWRGCELVWIKPLVDVVRPEFVSELYR